MAVVGLCPSTLRLTLLALAIFAGQVREFDKEKRKGKLPVSGFGQYVNLVVPSNAVTEETLLGDEQVNVKPVIIGVETAVMVI